MAFTPKLLLGGGVLGGVSVGLGIGELTSGAGKVKTPSRRSIAQECRLHELIGIAKGEFKPITKDEIRKRVADEKGDFGPIETACLANVGGDIFVSKKNGKWGYHQQDQDSQDHKDKFQRYLGNR
ncbi:hypothetical protein MHC_01810 [Mycoplasma haemocanis str. Illinois]|uniref:Uncharacterized protein n=1 Tax=Mycoplasma haemocanis (strain Illinois) TaxID=1111676 RepID=H6N6F6_MYCHN|nr:hypothetical protein [Mycoplasma haemocanis]AEW45228.1 hypothetical protein MHC_01810 [Mycoplasma haemocanis str. Illinois]